MATVKAGCFLIDKENASVALVYREKQNDFSFPKGHLDEGETIEECAIRETAEETKRKAKILTQYTPFEERYATPKGEECVCYMFIALDDGASDNTSEDAHPTIWVPFEKVEDKLTYESLKQTWKAVKNNIEEVIKA